MYKVSLRPKDQQMEARIVQTLGFHKMEIRAWDAAVQVGCHTVELNPIYCSWTILTKEIDSMGQVTPRPKHPQVAVRVV